MLNRILLFSFIALASLICSSCSDMPGAQNGDRTKSINDDPYLKSLREKGELFECELKVDDMPTPKYITEFNVPGQSEDSKFLDIVCANDKIYVLDNGIGNVHVFNIDHTYEGLLFEGGEYFLDERVREIDANNNGTVVVLSNEYLYFHINGKQSVVSNIYHIQSIALQGDNYWGIGGVGYPDQIGYSAAFFDLTGELHRTVPLEPYHHAIPEEIATNGMYFEPHNLVVSANKLILGVIGLPLIRIVNCEKIIENHLIIQYEPLVECLNIYIKMLSDGNSLQASTFTTEYIEFHDEHIYWYVNSMGKRALLIVDHGGNVINKYSYRKQYQARQSDNTDTVIAQNNRFSVINHDSATRVYSISLIVNRKTKTWRRSIVVVQL